MHTENPYMYTFLYVNMCRMYVRKYVCMYIYVWTASAA
jgi:hypothetical protein